MQIADLQTEKLLKDIMYPLIGFVKNGNGWIKPVKQSLRSIAGQVKCAKCKEYFYPEFIVRRFNNNYCYDCEKTIITKAYRKKEFLIKSA